MKTLLINAHAIQPGEQEGNLNTSLIKVRAKKFPFTDLKL